jgi:hypothetical protein
MKQAKRQISELCNTEPSDIKIVKTEKQQISEFHNILQISQL